MHKTGKLNGGGGGLTPFLSAFSFNSFILDFSPAPVRSFKYPAMQYHINM